MATFRCEVTLVVTDNLGVNYDQFFAKLSHSENSQLESVNLLVVGCIPEVRSMILRKEYLINKVYLWQTWTRQHIGLLFSKLIQLEMKHTLCLIVGEKHVADILDEGKKLDAYSMVCAYGKTETRVDILHKPSQDEVQLILTHTYILLCTHNT